MGSSPGSKERAAARTVERAERNSKENRDKHKPLDMGGKPGTMGEGRDRVYSKEGYREKFTARFDDGRVETHWLAVPPKKKRCKGKVRVGPYKGARCRKLALRGARVCLSHGGQLPAVKEAAKKRLLAASDIAVQGLMAIAFDGKSWDGNQGRKDADRIKALLAILDRAGLDGKQTVTIEVKPWQQALTSIEEELTKRQKTKKKKPKQIDGKASE